MKALQIKQFDENDIKIAEALISLGMNRNTAMALTYLRNTNSATSIELERKANLRQPEVSMAIRQLKEYDWITEREEKKSGRGRPYKIYTLKVRFKDIMAHLEKHNARHVFYVENFS